MSPIGTDVDNVDINKKIEALKEKMGKNEGFKNMENLMKKKQEYLSKRYVYGEAGAGAVRITMNCLYNAIELKINEDSVGGVGMSVLSELVVAAINDAVSKIEGEIRDAMTGILGDLGKMFDETGTGGVAA